MFFKRTLLILPLALALNACVVVTGEGDWDDDHMQSSWKAEQDHNRQNITKLSLGQDRPQVLTMMGNPNFTEAFTGENGSNYQILYYRTHREHDDGDTTKDETTPLVFENEKLIGWGSDALQRIR